jgi:NADH-quinone oxidoreductase subunit H
MRRLIFVLSSFALIGIVMAGITALAYGANMGLAYLASERGASPAWEFLFQSRIVNIVLFMLVFVMVLATLLTIAERKWSALIQDRIGPNRAQILGVRAAGLLHVVADSLKMVFKEDFRPQAATASRVLFALGPILAFAPVFALFAVVPPAPMISTAGHGVLFAGDTATPQKISLAVSEPDFGILFVFAIASLAVYGTSLAGWASNNKFALLGGVRASSQMISYEVALGLSLVGLMMTFSSVQLTWLIDGQTVYLWKT